MWYLLLVAGFPVVLLFDTRLGFAMIALAIILLYRSRTRTATRKVRRRIEDENAGRPMKAWKDPWGTGRA